MTQQNPGRPAVDDEARLRELEGKTELIIQQAGALRLRRFIGAARSLAALRVAVVLVRQTLLGIALVEAPRLRPVSTATAPPSSAPATRAVLRASLEIVERDAEPEPSLAAQTEAPPPVVQPSVHYRLILGAAATWWSGHSRSRGVYGPGFTAGDPRVDDPPTLPDSPRPPSLPTCRTRRG